MLKAENITKTFPLEGGIFRRRVGSVRALHNVSLEIHEGDSLGLLGESGSGKTTLGRVLCRILEDHEGRISWEGRPAESFTRREWAARVQMVFQDPNASLNPKLSVLTHLEEPLRVRSLLDGKSAPGSAELRKSAVELLDDVGLPEDALFYYPHQFSGGQKQRLAIARALAIRPRLLVADEPVSALDLSIQAQILNLLADLKERFHLAVVIISHDLAVVRHLADRVIVMKGGETVESGDTESVLMKPAHPYTRALLDAVPRLNFL